MLTQMRSFRLKSPKSNLLNTGSNEVQLCDHELDQLSTGEPITLNFQPGVDNNPPAQNQKSDEELLEAKV